MWTQLVGKRFSGEPDDRELLKRIRHGQKALQAIRCRIAIVWVLAAVSTGILVELFSAKCQAVHCLALHVEEDQLSWNFVGLVAEQAVLELCFVGRLMLLGLAPLADDAALTRLVLLWDAYVFAHTRIVMYVFQQVKTGDDLFGRAVLLSFYGRGVAFVVCASLAVCQHKPQRIQALMWVAVGIYAAWNGLDKVGRMIYEAIYFGRLTLCIGQVAACAVALYFVGNSRLRQRLQGKLQHWLEDRAAVRAAVTIACLIGGCQPREAVAQAKTRFRCISCAELSFKDFQDNTPDLSVPNHAIPTVLGHCDAFLSHSWHDDAEAKWRALQTWRKNFVAREGREPLVWFDKVCIDQSNIELDLRCLPIFLNGCARLVMLCGATYLNRLWCITEVFAYVHMGCEVENIELVPVVRDSSEDKDLDDIYNAFRSFDVRACECFNQEDKERIVTAIKTAFGCMDKFNCVVKRISRQVTGKHRIGGPLDEDSESLRSAPLSEGFSSEGQESDMDSGDEESAGPK